MEDKRRKDIIGIFFTNDGYDFCKNIPELKDCKELKSQYNEELHNKGKGCKPCRKKSLVNKFTNFINARLV